SKKSAAFFITEWNEVASSVYSPGDVKSHSGEVSKPLAVSKPWRSPRGSSISPSSNA
ncbi:hypothetical protein NDU88_000753, partial [Pleurodeles waltl]